MHFFIRHVCVNIIYLEGDKWLLGVFSEVNIGQKKIDIIGRERRTHHNSVYIQTQLSIWIKKKRQLVGKQKFYLLNHKFMKIINVS